MEIIFIKKVKKKNLKIFQLRNNNLSLYSFVYVREIRTIDNSRGLCAILRSHCPRIRSGDFISAAIENHRDVCLEPI